MPCHVSKFAHVVITLSPQFSTTVGSTLEHFVLICCIGIRNVAYALSRLIFCDDFEPSFIDFQKNCIDFLDGNLKRAHALSHYVDTDLDSATNTDPDPDPNPEASQNRFFCAIKYLVLIYCSNFWFQFLFSVLLS